MPGHKITTHEQRFGHVNATNRNSYLNIICIKLVKQVTKKLKFGLFEIFRLLET